MYKSTKQHAPLSVRLKNAARGFVIILAEEISYLGAVIIVVALAGYVYFFSPTRLELMILSLAVGTGVVVATFNFVVEELCDLYSTEYSEKIRAIKDAAAGGSSFFAAAFLTILILMSY